MAITRISRGWFDNPSIVSVITTDNLAAITTNGYITAQAANITAINNGTFEWQSNDVALIAYNGGEGFFTVDFTTNMTFIAFPSAPGSLPNTLNSAEIFVGSAGNIATGVAVTGDIAITNAGVTTIQNGVVNTAKLAATTIQYAQVVLSAANIAAMYGAPVQILGAAGANKAYMIDRIWMEYKFGTAQYTNGGALGLQYGNAAHLAGPAASTTLAGATFDAFAASNCFDLTPDGTDTLANIVNAGIFISNDTAAFATGDGTMNVNVAYRIVSTL